MLTYVLLPFELLAVFFLVIGISRFMDYARSARYRKMRGNAKYLRNLETALDKAGD